MQEPDTQSRQPVEIETIIDALEGGEPERIAAIAEEAHPGDVEQAFERLDPEDRESVLASLPAEVFSGWADYLPAADVETRLSTLPETEQREVLDSLSDDELADFLQEVEIEDRTQYIELLPEEKRQVSEDLLRYPEHTAGGRMTKAMAAVREGLTVKEALDELKSVREEAELLSRIFVLDEAGRLQGKLRLRDLAFAEWGTPVKDLMDNDRTAVDALADQEEAANMIARYDLLALPVVDEEGRVLGVITHDDAVEILEEESTEDIERTAGIGGERGELAYLQTPVLAHLKRRFGWVLVLAFLALTSGWVLQVFEGTLKAYYILAFYLPMVVAAGGNTGAQSATMVIRSMSLGELAPSEFWRVVWKESRVGILLGALLGICVAIQVQFLLPASMIPENLGTLQVAAVVGLALTAQIATSTLIGGSLPILARMARLDPAVVASPAITTIVDVSGSVIYFSLARMVFS